ncbi:hypothetical protein GPECTOR_97g754 [Gonium pectorale]|uniref:Peptidase M11 gametolysin domain-containing protein n=1 Tax=Gonium pectorale TaxID=33097 RepID=A0A150G011_GONPE|nr:hypothetical protein GPECTOR_97g754 [Gonium pectorale]|eukprot:KXZ43216.1 hypothetical protein GPECTOR_97g754 [Gonium pectorale]
MGAGLRNYYRTCSYNKTSFDPRNVVVVGPLQVDCSGTLVRGVFSYPFDASTSCGAAEQIFWVQAAEEQARLIAQTDPAVNDVMTYSSGVSGTPARRRVILMLPNQARCSWAGLADVSCASPTCRSFIKTTANQDAHVLFHELQHNYGLSHSGRGFDEYGDPTDPMGNFNSAGTRLLCHGAAYNYRIGWAKPINAVPGVGDGEYGMLTAANFSVANNHLTFTIPASYMTDENMVIVYLGASFRGEGAGYNDFPKYFLSYRAKAGGYGGFDNGLPTSSTNKLLIHSYLGEQTDRDFNRSQYIDTLPRSSDPVFGNGTVWDALSAGAPSYPYDNSTGLGGGLRVRLISWTPTAARVEVCRMYAAREGTPGSEECNDGVDRDW